MPQPAEIVLGVLGALVALALGVLAFFFFVWPMFSV